MMVVPIEGLQDFLFPANNKLTKVVESFSLETQLIAD